jgi:hypothetical protein
MMTLIVPRMDPPNKHRNEVSETHSLASDDVLPSIAMAVYDSIAKLPISVMLVEPVLAKLDLTAFAVSERWKVNALV